MELNPSHKFMILASDGVWEFISSKEAVEIVGQYDTVEEACRQVSFLCSVHFLMLKCCEQELHALSVCLFPFVTTHTFYHCAQLVDEAYQRWLIEEEGVVDDITAVVVYFKHD